MACTTDFSLLLLSEYFKKDNILNFFISHRICGLDIAEHSPPNHVFPEPCYIDLVLPAHEFHETCHSVTFIVVVNSHQR